MPLGVVTGLAGAQATGATVVVGGLAEAVAGALAMGTGAYLSSAAENRLFQTEIAEEEHELEIRPDVEKEELKILLQEEGLSEPDAGKAVQLISTSKFSLLKTKVEKELGLPYGEHATSTARGDAFVVGLSYAAAALIPLWPYFIFSVSVALPISLIATGLALFGLGVAKGRVTRDAILRSGLQVLVIGGASAGAGYSIGRLAPNLFG